MFDNETLASGKTVKVTMLALVWGAQTNDNDGCVMGGDCFHLEFVSNVPNAEMLGFKQVERTGDYDLFEFERATNGTWSCEQKAMSVFAK